MKKNIRFIAIIVIAFALTLIGCEPNKKEEVTIIALQDKITINVEEVLEYNYKSLFTIKSGTSDIEVKDEYLDLSNIKAEVGTYYIICTYDNKIASINVEVIKPTTISINLLINSDVVVNNLTVFNTNYKEYFEILDDNKAIEVKDEYLDLSNLRSTQGSYKIKCTYQGVTAELTVIVEEISYQIKLNTYEVTIKQSEVETYDFNQAFVVVVNGKIQPITPEMVESNVLSDVGSYQYKVSLGETSMTLKVNVISDHVIEIINSYNLIEIEVQNLDNFDYTTLFSVYLDGQIRKVTLDMIDKSSLENPIEDEIYEIKVTYKEGQAVGMGSCKIKVVPNSEIIITPKNLIIYPNSEYVDLTTLFTIFKKDQEIPVTLDMINGTINYAEVGENSIKINYLGIEKEAIVEVKQGVIINTTKGDVVKIAKGTSQSSYDFSADFKVFVNGINFTNISSYIDTSNVDFNTIGSYTVTINVPYTDSTLGIEKGTIFSKEITYEVVKSIYSIRVMNETVVLKADTKDYNPFDNLIVKINGVNQKLTKIASQASALATYAEVISTIDFTSIGMQEVVVDIYVDGPENDPVRTVFNIIIESNITINVNKTFVFEGETVYTKDLFTISLNEEIIEVNQDMIEGKVDTSTPGVYPVTITYQGIKETINFIVLNIKMVGNYDTLLTTIPVAGSSDEDGYEETGKDAVPLKKLFITESGEISVNGSLAKILYGIDENTIYIEFNKYEFTLSYHDGIVFIDPNNDLRMGFIEPKRPLLYFNEEMWELNQKVNINSTSQHVLELNYNSYSFDIFNVTNKATNETMWYALKINLYEKISSDIKYIVNHGEVIFDESFEQSAENKSFFTYHGEKYKFTMASELVGKIDSIDDNKEYKYANKTFTATINGQSAELVVDAYEGFILRIAGDMIFSASGASIRNQKYGGVNYDTDTVLIVDKGSNTEMPFSYKINLNLVDNTFTLVERDMYFGRYESDKIYIFFDGFGTGLINFDKTQYAETLFEYTTMGNLINMTFVNIAPGFANGTEASVYIDEFNNTLTVKYFANPELLSEVLINSFIIDGAIVNISSYEMKVYSNTVLAKKAFYDLITVITKDGEITNNTIKKEIVNITDIDFKTAGIYHFSITVSVNNNDVTMHYAIQIV